MSVPKPRTEPAPPRGSAQGADETGREDAVPYGASGRPALPAPIRTRGGQGPSLETQRRRELRAQFRDLAEAEAERAERECPLVPGSDAALELKALAGDDLAGIVRNRLAREHDPAA